MAKAILEFTVTTTLHQQERNVLDDLVQAHRARLELRPPPSLLQA